MMGIGSVGGRFIADVNTSVPPQASVENYTAFVETIDRLGRYC